MARRLGLLALALAGTDAYTMFSPRPKLLTPHQMWQNDLAAATE